MGEVWTTSESRGPRLTIEAHGTRIFVEMDDDEHVLSGTFTPAEARALQRMLTRAIVFADLAAKLESTDAD